MRGILPIAISLIIAPASGVGDDKEFVPNLVGEYALILPGAVGPNSIVGKMSVFAQNGNRFLIGISERSANSAENWRGQGILNGNDGYYDWTFSDGKKGRTTFTLDADGNLRGHVRGSGINWHYLAKKQAEEVELHPSLEGVYTVSRTETPDRVITYLRISAQQGARFQIAIARPTGSMEQDWAGAGEMHDGEGSYEWVCANGSAGTTTFILAEDGTIRGSVQNTVEGEDADWEFIARRAEAVPAAEN